MQSNVYERNLKSPSRDLVVLSVFILIKFILSYVLVSEVYELHRDEFLHLDQANHLAAGFTSVTSINIIIFFTYKVFGQWFILG